MTHSLKRTKSNKQRRIFMINRMDRNEGSLQDRYDIYVTAMEELGQPTKDFDEWLDS